MMYNELNIGGRLSFSGVIIPDLSQERSEFPDIEGIQRLQNPGVNDGIHLEGPYSPIELAQSHLKTIHRNPAYSDTFHIIGVGALGGMIAAVLGSEFRSQLPSGSKFYFLGTSLNSSTNPAITPELVKDWDIIQPGDIQSFKKNIAPFFSKTFLENSYEKAYQYFNYRRVGNNHQQPSCFLEQVSAIKNFKAEPFFEKLNLKESIFFNLEDDQLYGKNHWEDLRKACPTARHIIVGNIGHLIHIEKPEIFEQIAEGRFFKN